MKGLSIAGKGNQQTISGPAGPSSITTRWRRVVIWNQISQFRRMMPIALLYPQLRSQICTRPTWGSSFLPCPYAMISVTGPKNVYLSLPRWNFWCERSPNRFKLRATASSQHVVRLLIKSVSRSVSVKAMPHRSSHHSVVNGTVFETQSHYERVRRSFSRNLTM